jgi:hypothetical protein
MKSDPHPLDQPWVRFILQAGAIFCGAYPAILLTQGQPTWLKGTGYVLASSFASFPVLLYWKKRDEALKADRVPGEEAQ